MTRRRCSRRLGVAVLLLVLSAGAARAVGVLHLTLLDSAPKKDETVAAAPKEIRLRFSERVEPRLTSVTLLGADSAAVTLARVQVAGDPAIVAAPVVDTIRPGAYEVRWRTSSRDGHVVRGTFTFTLRPAP